MAAPGEDNFQQLKFAVDSWVAEVFEVRTALSEKLRLEIDTTRPAFGLEREGPAVGPLSPADMDHDASVQAQARASAAEREKKRAEAELEFAREQLEARNHDANEAVRIAEQKAQHLEETARALGRMRIELNEATEQLRAKEWALLQLSNENVLLRGDPGAAAMLERKTVPAEDYDAIVESHKKLREEVSLVQERLVQRDHELIALRAQLDDARAELAAWESSSPVSSAGVARLAGVLAERSAALEEIENTALGQKYLVGALRQELDAVRGTLERRELDHDRLASALRTELECLRSLSAERDFVVGHQAHAVEAAAIRESALENELTEARELCETLRRRAELAAEENETLTRDLQLMRGKLSERENEVWRLRATPAAPVEASNERSRDSQLQAELASRDAELERARDRIEFLRALTRESAPAVSFFDTTLSLPPTPIPLTPNPSTSMDLHAIQMNSRLQKEVEDALALRFPWQMFGLVGVVAGIGLLALGLFALFLTGS